MFGVVAGIRARILVLPRYGFKYWEETGRQDLLLFDGVTDSFLWRLFAASFGGAMDAK